jgi:hypothetical protein
VHASRAWSRRVENAAGRHERTVNKVTRIRAGAEGPFDSSAWRCTGLSICPATSGGAEATETAVPASSPVAS